MFSPLRSLLLVLGLCATAQAYMVPVSGGRVATRAPVAQMNWFGGFGGGAAQKEEGGLNARDADFARRQDKLAARQAKAATQPKGAVECTFPQKGNKVVQAKQGEPIGAVVKRAGLRVKFDCKVGSTLPAPTHPFALASPSSSALTRHALAPPSVILRRAEWPLRDLPGAPQRAGCRQDLPGRDHPGRRHAQAQNHARQPVSSCCGLTKRARGVPTSHTAC